MKEVVTTIGDALKLKSGTQLSAKNMREGNYPVFGGNGISGYHDEYIFEEPKIIIGRVGAYCGNIHLTSPKSWITDNALYIDEKKVSYYDQYLIYLLRNLNLNRFASQSGQPLISFGRIKKVKIPLPPLPEQKKIAAILDEADQLRQLNQKVLEKYDTLTQSLFLEMFGDPVTNPKGWEKVNLKECTSKIGSGATPRGGKEAYKSEGISLIRSMNVYDNWFKNKNLAFIDNDQADKLKNVTVEKNDVLFNITGASVCRCTIVPEEILPARVNQHVAILRPSSLLNSIFLNHTLISKNCKLKLLGVGSQNASTREAITKESLEKFKIPLPPIALQTQFADRIKTIETQKAQAQAALKESEDLFNSLLQKAFKGELTK